MKKQRILSMVVALVMILGSFAGISVSAEATATAGEDFSSYEADYEVKSKDNWVRMFEYKYDNKSYSYFGDNGTLEDGAVLSLPATVTADGMLKVTGRSISGTAASGSTIGSTAGGATLFNTFAPIDMVTGRENLAVTEQKAVFEFDLKHGIQAGSSTKWSDFYIGSEVDGASPKVYAGFRIDTHHVTSTDDFYWSISPASKIQYNKISAVHGAFNEKGEAVTDTLNENRNAIVNVPHKVRIELVTKTGGSNASFYRLYLDGVKIGDDYPTLTTISADTKLASFAYRPDGIGTMYLDNLSAKLVTSVDKNLTVIDSFDASKLTAGELLTEDKVNNADDSWYKHFTYKDGANTVYTYVGGNDANNGNKVATEDDSLAMSVSATVVSGTENHIAFGTTSISGTDANNAAYKFSGTSTMLVNEFTPFDVYTAASSDDVRNYSVAYNLNTAINYAANHSGFRDYTYYIRGYKEGGLGNAVSAFKIQTNKTNGVYYWKMLPASVNNKGTVTFSSTGYAIDGSEYTGASVSDDLSALYNVKVVLNIKKNGEFVNTASFYVNGVKVGEDMAINPVSENNKYIGSVSFQHPTGSATKIKIGSYAVTAASRGYGELITDKNINFENGSAEGLNINGTVAFETYTGEFGYNKYLKVTDATSAPSVKAVLDAELPKDFSDNYKTVVMADIMAKPGTTLALGNAAVMFDENSSELGFNGNDYTVATTYENGKWYRVRLDLYYAKGEQEYKYADLYIDGRKVLENVYCPYNELKEVSISGNKKDGIAFDNLKVFATSGSAEAVDDTKLLYEIRYANELINYYETETFPNGELVKTKITGAYGDFSIDDSYASLKVAVDAAEALYVSGADEQALEEAYNNIEKYLALIGGEIAEYRFDGGIDRSFEGEGTYAEDELDIIGSYLNVTGDAVFNYPAIRNGKTTYKQGEEATGVGAGYGVAVSMDIKAAAGKPVVKLGDEGASPVQIRLNIDDNVMEYYTGSEWVVFATDIEADKWYTVSALTRVTSGGGGYNGKYTLYLDGIKKAESIAYAEASDYMSQLKVSDVSDSTPLAIDNIVVTPKSEAVLGAMQYYHQRGILTEIIRRAQAIYNQYKENTGTDAGQCTEESFKTLETALKDAIGRHERRQYRLQNNGEFTNPSATLEEAIAGIEVIPFKNYYINSIYYLDEDAEQNVYSPQVDCYVDGVSITRYAETIEDGTALIVALYNGGALTYSVSIPLADEILPVGETSKVTIDGGILIEEEDTTVKAFIINMNTLKALADAFKSSSLGEEKVSIYIASDSIYRNYDYSNPQTSEYPQHGIGQALSNYFNSEKVQVKNKAISGYSSRTFIENGKLADIASEIKKGDYLFVSFGHNDSVESKSAYTDINSYKKYLNKFIDTAALCGANTVILTPPVRNLKDTDSTSIALKAYSEAAIEVAEARNVPYIDLNTLSASEKAIYGDALYNIYEAEDARYANDEMFKNSMYYLTGRTDNTHLCKFGAEIFAGIIADELSRIYHPLMDAVVDFTPVRP